MPRYEYTCPAHGQQSINKAMRYASDAEFCADCGAPMERVYFPTASLIPGGTPIHHDRAWLRGPGGKSQERKP